MKNFRFFPKVEDYEAFVREEIFKTDLVRQHPFYSNLISWVVKNRLPLFFEASDSSEHAHFTQYFGMFLMRDYDNPYQNDLYYLHDFVHSMFYYPMYPRKMAFEDFYRLCVDHEWISSNETEVLVHHRIPQLRPLVFQDSLILYDLLSKSGYNEWSPQALFTIRRALASSDAMWGMFYRYGKDVLNIKKYMSHVASNMVWCAMWYDNVPYFYGRPFWHEQSIYLTHDNYESVISNYQPERLTQGEYKHKIAMLARTWSVLTLGEETSFAFDDVPQLLERMNEKIMLPEAARVYALMRKSK